MKKIKIILLLSLSFLYLESLLANEILLQKNGVIITNSDLENYKDLHNDYHGNKIIGNAAIKNLYMIFTIVDKQIRDNPNFINITNDIIKKDIHKYKEIYSEYIMSYFLRYEILKSDFIDMYINKNGIKMLDNLIDVKINLYNDADCKTTNKVINLKELKIDQKKIILTNISNDSIFIKEIGYACLSKESKEKIYNLTSGILSEEGHEKFLEYVYKNIK